MINFFTGKKRSKREGLDKLEILIKKLAGRRVLLVEDTPFNQEIATAFLKQINIDVDLVQNGQEAVDFLSVEANVKPISAVLMDVQMPIMDGFEATRRIRSQLDLKSMPIIAMTANAMKGDKQKCLDSGMDDYISKPVSQDVLYSKLAKWVLPEEHEPMAELDTNQEPEPALAPSADALDLDLALEQMGGDQDMLDRMLMLFKDDQQESVLQIMDAYDNGDAELAHRLAHTLKGVSASIAAESLRFHAAELEDAIERGALSTHIEKLFFKADTALKETLDYIAQLEEIKI